MIQDLYLKKLMNLIPLSFFDLTDNMLCLYNDRSKFQEHEFLNNSLKDIFHQYGNIKDIATEDLSDKIKLCSYERQKYFDILLSLLNKMDYIHYISFEKEINNLLEDEQDSIDYKKITNGDDFPNLLNTTMSCVLPFLDEKKRNDFFSNFFTKNCDKTDLYTLDSLLNSALHKAKTKVLLGEDIFDFHTMISRDKTIEELSEISELSLKYFHFCQYIFNCYSNFIVLYTYIEEYSLIFNENLIIKDIYYTTSKIVLNNEKTFIEQISQQVEYLLDEHFEEKEKIDKIFIKSKFKEEEKKVEHKYIDSIVSLLNETPHYVGGFISDKNNMNILVDNTIIKTRVNEFLQEFYSIVENISDIGKLIVYMALINNLQVGMKFYKITLYPTNVYSENEVIDILKSTIENSETSNKNLLSLSLNKFINY